VPGAQSLGVGNGGIPQLIIIALCSGQAGTRSFVESQPELGLWHGIHHRLVHVFRSFDEVRLTDDDVRIFRELYPHRFKLEHRVSNVAKCAAIMAQD
jgi:hypothetical protein